MKYIISLLILVALSINAIAQKKSGTKPWDAASTKEAFKQGDDGVLLLYIKIQGSDYDDCKAKAEKAAIYIAIFQGYDANVDANIPKTGPLAKESVYDQNLSYFDAFFADGGKYKSYVTKSDKHPTMIAEMKVDKRTVEANIVVTIRKAALQQRLIDDHIIQPLIAQDAPAATVIIVPDDSYMDSHGYKKEIDAGGYMTTVYDYVRAAKDPAYETALKTIAAELTGQGKGMNKIDMAGIQSAIETKDANQEMAKGASARKLTAAEVLNNKATWDYTIKLNIKEEIDGTAVKYAIGIDILDMFTLKVETAKPINLQLSSSGNRDQQIERGLLGAMEELSTKIAANYKEKVEIGFNGKVNFYISSKSKGDFNSSITTGSGETGILGDVPYSILSQLTVPGKEPQVEGVASELTRSYNEVYIPFKVMYKAFGQPEKPITNSFETFGLNFIKKLDELKIQGLKITKTARKGTVDFFITY